MIKRISCLTICLLFYACLNKKIETSKIPLYEKKSVNNLTLSKDTNFLKLTYIYQNKESHIFFLNNGILSFIYYYNEILNNIGLSNLFFYNNGDCLVRLFVKNSVAYGENCKAFIFNFEKKENEIYTNYYQLGKSSKSYIISGNFNDSIFKSKESNNPEFSLGINLYKGTPIYDSIISAKLGNFNVDSVHIFLKLLANFINPNHNKYVKDSEYFSPFIFLEINLKGKYYLYSIHRTETNDEVFNKIIKYLLSIGGLKNFNVGKF